MPELPEVQTVVNDLNAADVLGKTIVGSSVTWPRTVATHSPQGFARVIKGQTIQAVTRRAKYIVMHLDDYRLIVHLRMTGRMHFREPSAKREKHEHVTVRFDDGRELRYHDTRKFGRWYLVRDEHEVLTNLGPEPLEKTFTLACFKACLAGRTRAMKPLLLDQSVIAGLGNIYVDEALFDAGIHPERGADSLTAEEVRKLHRAIPKVLKRGLKNMGTSLGNSKANFYSVAKRQGRNKDELKVFRRTGLPCPVCRDTVVRFVVGQRSTHICPTCQPLKI